MKGVIMLLAHLSKPKETEGREGGGLQKGGPFLTVGLSVRQSDKFSC